MTSYDESGIEFNLHQQDDEVTLLTAEHKDANEP
jgi:hypothetical protein